MFSSAGFVWDVYIPQNSALFSFLLKYHPALFSFLLKYHFLFLFIYFLLLAGCLKVLHLSNSHANKMRKMYIHDPCLVRVQSLCTCIDSFCSLFVFRQYKSSMDKNFLKDQQLSTGLFQSRYMVVAMTLLLQKMVLYCNSILIQHTFGIEVMSFSYLTKI